MLEASASGHKKSPDPRAGLKGRRGLGLKSAVGPLRTVGPGGLQKGRVL
jgi:hypothetical protein